MIRLTEPADLGPALIAIRKQLDVRRLDVANAVDMLPQQYGQYELGRRAPSLGVLIRIANACGYDIAFAPQDRS